MDKINTPEIASVCCNRRPSVTANGCDLWGIDFIHGANTPILRVFIDAVGGATIEDCEKISKDLNYELPLDNFFAELDYTLEASKV